MHTSLFQAPELTRVLEFIAIDARHDRFAWWGSSTVIDENTGEPVIDRLLFDALHAAAGISAEFPVGNAGVIHVYGYWFSTVLTPYGYKRDRWEDGELAVTLGEAPTAFHLVGDAASTPLLRVTAAALPCLLNPPATALARADVRVDGLDSRVVLVGEDASSGCALIYGIRLGGSWRLITTFPLSVEPAAIVEDFLSDRRLRWNAALPANP